LLLLTIRCGKSIISLSYYFGKEQLYGKYIYFR